MKGPAVEAARASAVDPAAELLARHPALAVLRLGLPQAIGLMAHALLNLVDLVLVGRLGEEAIAAAGVATTINFVPMVFGNGIATASLAWLSQRIGSGDLAAARALHDRCQRFMLWFGIAVSVLTALPVTWCVDSIGLTGAARTDAITYLLISNLGCLPMFALMQVTTGMRAIGEVAVPLGLLTFANVLNLLLDLVWMFGWDAFGLHGIGVVGAACATVTARTIAALLGYAWLCRRSHPLRLSLRRLQGPAVARQMVALAAPQTLQILLRALLACAVLLLAQRAAGAAAVAALGITTRLDTLMLFASVGFASAATTLVGRCVARGERERSRQLGRWAGVEAAVFASVLVAVLYWYRRGIVWLFLPEASDAVVDAAARYLGIGALAHPFACFALGAIGALHGVGAMRAALLVDVAGFLGVAAGLAIGMASGAGLAGIYWGLVLGLLLLAALHAVYLQWGSWAGRAAL